VGRDHPPFRWQPGRRILLQAEIDAAMLHLYGLSQMQAEWLLDSFTVLQKYEERDHGEFRTKRIVLEIYDEIASAKLTGRAYQTRLISLSPSALSEKSRLGGNSPDGDMEVDNTPGRVNLGPTATATATATASGVLRRGRSAMES
jgi:hypothetical protein